MGHVGIIIGVLALIVFAGGVTPEKLLFLGIAGMVILSPFLYAMNRLNMAQNQGVSVDDLNENQVLSACGEVLLHPAVGINASDKVEIENMTFRLPKNGLQVLDAETAYCIYYAPHSKRIISIEEQV